MSSEHENNSAKKKHKIVFGFTSLWTGGAQVQFIRQLRFFDHTKYEIHVVSLTTSAHADSIADQIAGRAHVHEFQFKGFFDVSSYRALYKKLKELQPDLVVTSLFFANSVFRVLQPLLRYPVISREHNTYTDRKKAHRLIDRILARVTYKIVAVSEEVAEYESVHSRIPQEKFVVIENGIDLKEIETARSGIDRSALRQELGIHEDELVFLFVGRLVLQKNVDVIIRGFREFYAKHEKSKLVLVGDSIIIDDLKKLAGDEGVANAVVFAGHQSDVHKYYAAADVFVSASEREGLSNTQLEALAHGLPLLTTKTGGTRALLRDTDDEKRNGFLIAAATPEGVAAALEKAAAADRAALGAAAKAHAKHFDILRTVERYEALFNEVIKRHG